MKRFFLFLLFIVSFFYTRANTVRWDGGGGDGLWSTAANWENNVLPAPSDDVVLNNDFVLVSYNVDLPNSAVTVRSLRITPFTSSTPITLTLPATNTIASGAFTVTGNSTHYSIIIDAGGTFENDGAVSSGTNLSITDSMRINNGGYYLHRTRSDHSWITRLAKIEGTENGVFTFDVPAVNYNVSISGGTFGILIFSALAQGGAITYTATGSADVNVKGDMNINTNAEFSLAMSGNIIVGGTLSVNAGSTFDFQSASFNNVVKLYGSIFYSSGALTQTGLGIPQIELCGTTNQNIFITGSFTNHVEFNINNAAGVTLQTPVTLPYKLLLTNGKLKTTASRLLTLMPDATCSGGSSASFVNGPIKKIGNNSFSFPVGEGGIYAPIAITNVSGEQITDEFTAEYKRSNPQSSFGTNYSSGINHVSFVEYWNLNRNVGNTSVKNITLTVSEYSFARNFSSLMVSNFSSSQWVNLGLSSFNAGPNVGIKVTGTITGTGTMLGGPFAIATADPIVINPLPVDLISFHVNKTGRNKAFIDWELAGYCTPDTRFEIERATADRRFTTIASIYGNETDRFYSAMDNDLQTGINYYRLKTIDADRQISYSRIEAILNGIKGLYITTLSPNPSSSKTIISIVSDTERSIELLVIDLQGRLVKKEKQLLSAGNNTITLLMDGLIHGIYQVVAVSSEGKTNVMQLVKE